MARTTSIISMTVAAVASVWAQGQIVAVVNSASFQPGLTVAAQSGSETIQGMPSGGSLATVFLSGFNGLTPGTYVAPPSSPLPFTLGGLAVIVNGAPSPILSVIIPVAGSTAYAQVNFQVPMERNAVTQGALGCPNCSGPTAVDVNGATFTIPAVARGWGGFFSDANGYAMARHGNDNTLVSVLNPAHAGETIIVYADDFFDVWPPPPIGFPVPTQPPFTFNPALYTGVLSFAVVPNFTKVTDITGLYLQDYPGPGYGGPPPLPGPVGSFTSTTALRVIYEGLAAGMVGVEEIHFVVPDNQVPGDWALFFNNGSCTNGKGPCITSGVGVSSAYVKLPVR